MKWTKEEKDRLQVILFSETEGEYSPDYEKVAKILNEEFKNNRTAKDCILMDLEINLS